jgi:hypothetical protein
MHRTDLEYAHVAMANAPLVHHIDAHEHDTRTSLDHPRRRPSGQDPKAPPVKLLQELP